MQCKDKDSVIAWLFERAVLAKSQFCDLCSNEMKLVKCEDRSDGVKWEYMQEAFRGKDIELRSL